MTGLRRTRSHNLKDLLARLVKTQPSIEEIYLFGSRAHNTGSHRSDCDLLVVIPKGTNHKPSDFRDFSTTQCSALDLFLCEDAIARSCSNDSYIYADSFAQLVSKLGAIPLWKRTDSFADFAFIDTGDWSFETSSVVDFSASNLPDSYVGEQAWHSKLKAVEAEGLPACPFIGDTLDKAVDQISDVAHRMIMNPSDLGPKGAARSGWTVDLRSEYDCQNLFFTVTKPWLSELAREENAITYDEQKKISDFSLFQGKLIIEMKFIDSKGKKREVIKTLDGLSRFYSRNSNVGCLLMIIYFKEGVSIDARKWEEDYTFLSNSPKVITKVIPVP